MPVSEHGNRIGEHHHRATIPDEIVTLIRDMREHHGVEVAEIARKLALNYCTVRSIVYYKRRACTPADWRRVPIEQPPQTHE